MNQTYNNANSQTINTKREANESFYSLAAKCFVPDWLIRMVIRRMLSQTLKARRIEDPEEQIKNRMDFIEELKHCPIAIHTENANDQHYEVPTAFFKAVLGPHMKYSSAFFANNETDLGRAEDWMLDLTCIRAQLKPGHNILELGCGWGSLTFFMAENYPNCEITALTNSATQCDYLQNESIRRGLKNVKIIKSNIEDFKTSKKFDRVVSVEMFEHMKNYELLLSRIADWLVADGKLFVHIFTHKDLQYHFEDNDGSDWLTRHFFAGGTMPSDALLLYFQSKLRVTGHWRINGMHYKRTAEAWLHNMKKNRQAINSILTESYGAEQAQLRYFYWRLFFLSCAELWGYKQGTEWMISHYLFEK
jgi:cyclopropane-fatty-acyl-phospholipid synthase